VIFILWIFYSKEVNNTNVFSDSLIINIPPAPFKGGDVMVNIHEKHFGYVKKVSELCGVEVTET